MEYKILNQYHENYDHNKHERQEALYKGGDYLIEHIKLFIKQNPGEHPNAYDGRLQCASYINYMAEIIDHYTSNLFSKQLTVIPAGDATNSATPGDALQDKQFYQDFATNCDLSGTSFSAMMKKILTETLTHGVGYVGIDFPLINEIPSNLAEEEAIGAARAYLYYVSNESLINYECDEFNKLKWCVLKKCYSKQDSPFNAKDKKTIQFKVWTIENNYAKWQLFEITTKLNREPKPNDEVQLVSEGITSFHEIPILALEVEEGLCISNKIGNLCVDHLKERTNYLFAKNRSLNAVPYYKIGPEFDSNGMSSPISEDNNRGAKAARQFANRGMLVIGHQDELGFLEPSGSSFELTAKSLDSLADEIHRIVHQMANSVASSSTSLGRSGLSKEMDNRATEIILTEYGNLVKQLSVNIYNCIAEARNENIIWQAIGLSNYQIVDKDLLIKEAMAVNNTLNIPSNTFKKSYLSQLANALLPGLAPETQIVIKSEIDKSVDSGEHEFLYEQETTDIKAE